MGKKKKTYKVSSKPKVAAMNEYIYNTLKDDLAKEYKVAKPYKPKKIRKAQAMKGVTVTQGEPVKYKPKPKPKTFREAGLKYGKGFKSKGGKPLPPTTSFKKFKVGDPNYTVKKAYAPPKGYVAPSQIPVKQQKLLKDFKGSGSYIREKYKGKYYVREYPEYTGKPKPKYKSGTSSPLNKKVIQKASKPLSFTAKKAIISQGAKLAAKGATRLIPGVGTAMLAKDVYNVLTKSEATKYVPQFGAKNVSKKYKKGKNY